MLAALLFAQALIGDLKTPPGFQALKLYGKLNSPTSMAIAPDGRVFVCQQSGEVRVFKNDSLLDFAFVTVPTRVYDEEGLSGIALDPDFAKNGFVYLGFTGQEEPYRNNIVRYTAHGDTADPASERVIIVLDPPRVEYHLGGSLVIGADGCLYIGTGEGGTKEAVQRLDNLFGKVLRINRDGSIPADNPYVDSATGANRAIWARGFRNPFTAAADAATGRLFFLDVGGDQYEEINEVVKGGNYGWPASEGMATGADRAPLLAYPHGLDTLSGNSVCGGLFYPAPPAEAGRGPAGAGRREVASRESDLFPAAMRGKFFFADFTNGWINSIDPQHPGRMQVFCQNLSAPVDLALAPDGSIYCLQRGRVSMDGGTGEGWNHGSLVRIAYTGNMKPAMAENPEDAFVPAGEGVTFRIAAGGRQPLTYRWQKAAPGQAGFRDVPGADGPLLTLAAAALRDDGARYRCTVRNTEGTVVSKAARLRVTADRRPEALIESPAEGLRYDAGDTLVLKGAGRDPEEGALRPGALTWRVEFHHDDHSHPALPPTRGTYQASYPIPDNVETSDNVFYRVYLRVVDREGLEHTAYRDVRPNKARLEIDSKPEGMSLVLDHKWIAAPFACSTVVGVKHLLEAVTPQWSESQNRLAHFKSWSGGGNSPRLVIAPRRDERIIAEFHGPTFIERVKGLLRNLWVRLSRLLRRR